MPAPSAPADDVTILARTAPREIVRYIVEHPSCYYGDIREAKGTAISSLTRDLRLLEEVGVVQTDVSQPIGSRRGRSPRYTVDVERVEALLSQLREQLLGTA